MSDNEKFDDAGEAQLDEEKKFEEEMRLRQQQDRDAILTSADRLRLVDPAHQRNHDDWQLAREFWVRSHPALQKANDAIARAKHEAAIITGILAELFEERCPEPFRKGPQEGLTQEQIDIAKKEAGEDLVKLREALKAYNVSFPRLKAQIGPEAE